MYRNILVINLMHLGDLMLVTPVLHTLRQNYPAARITLLADAKLADIVRRIPSCDALLLGSERADLVRRIAGETAYTAQDSANARLLTMLHRGLPPEEVTPKKIRSTFWELRNELITTREFWEEMKQRRAKKKS